MNNKKELQIEAQDRTFIIYDMIQSYLLEHPGFTKAEKAELDRLSTDLYQVYVNVGKRD